MATAAFAPHRAVSLKKQTKARPIGAHKRVAKIKRPPRPIWVRILRAILFTAVALLLIASMVQRIYQYIHNVRNH